MHCEMSTRLQVWLFLLCSSTVFAAGSNGFLENILSFPKDYNDYLLSGFKNERLQETLELVRMRMPWKGANLKFDPLLFDVTSSQEKEPLTCALCVTLVDSVFGWIDAGESREELVERAVGICLDLNIQKEKICRGMVENNIDIFIFINSQREVLATDVCGFALYPSCHIENPLYNWTVNMTFAGPKPPVQIAKLPPVGSPTFKVLHISDLHLDLFYNVGGNAECDEPTCCRADQGPPANSEATAGYWGDYRNCDMPWHSFVDMLEHIWETHKDIEYVIFTGDVPDHAVWNTSLDNNAEVFTKAYREMARVFDVPVFPIFGNFEPHPTNQFAEQNLDIPDTISSRWLYNLAQDTWSMWLPPQTNGDILGGGFYANQAHDQLWIIAINNNFCNKYNLWNLYDNNDPGGQLKWLINMLTMLESQGRKAHIISHTPPGVGSCVNSWAREYKKIIDRFETTVIGQFNGHNHNDQFFVYYDPDDLSRPSGVSFLTNSMTPYSEKNPSYRIYTMEGTYPGTHYRVLDHENWYYNLTEANAAGSDVKPNWQRLYNFNEEFGTKALTPVELDQLLHRMVNNTSLLDKYFRFHVSNADPGLTKGCDRECHRRLFCRIVETVEGDLRKCEELWPSQTRR